MDNKIRQLQQSMNDYLIRTGADKSTIHNSLGLFYSLSCDIEKGLLEYFYTSEPIDYTKISKITFTDKIELVKKFHEKIGVQFDFDKAIADGTIDFTDYDLFNDNNDLESKKRHYMLYGVNTYENSKKIVNVPNTGLITDVLVTVHELSHLRNQPDDSRNQTNDLFTEALAYADELMCVDYLSKLGYTEEMKLWKKELFKSFYIVANRSRPMYKLFLLYKELGSISKEDYVYYFKSESEYEPIINYMSKFIDNQSFDLYYNSWYVLATLLSAFMYTEYKKDNNFSKNVLELHNSIDRSTISECLKIIGLKDLGKEDKIKMSKSLEEVVKELAPPKLDKSTSILK